MKKRITVENIDAIIEDAHDLENEEILACQVGNYNLNRYEALMRELDDLKFHIAKFADEGATLAEINAYDDIISYAEKTFKNEDFFEFSNIFSLFAPLARLATADRKTRSLIITTPICI